MSVSASVTVTVSITNDEQATRDFMQWQLDESVFPIKGTVTCGLGNWFGTFDGDDEKAVMGYFATRRSGRSDSSEDAP